jgi:heme-degrading monooxygenase HmoA
VIQLKMYFTGGTETFLKKFLEENEQETLVFMHNEDAFLLVHETEGSSLFKEPREYEVVLAKGTIVTPSGYAVFNHIPVRDEGRPVFEYHFKNNTNSIEKQHGFKAIRVLRPRKSDTYIVFTLWKSEADYITWKKSPLFSEVYTLAPKIFLRPSFVTKYKIYEEKEDE